MNERVRGEKPRPRVALLGGFAGGEVEAFEQMFPTVHSGHNMQELNEAVNPREVDLLVIAPDGKIDLGNHEWLNRCHIISFSNATVALPGPVDGTHVFRDDKCTTEVYVLPALSLQVDRIRAGELAGISGIRGWPCLRAGLVDIGFGIPSPDPRPKASTILTKTAVLREKATGNSLGSVSYRGRSVLAGKRLGLAWLPSRFTRRVQWVQAIVADWSKEDPDGLPGFGDWQADPRWMTTEELELHQRVEELERRRGRTLEKLSKVAADLEQDLVQAQVDADSQSRRLITAQGDGLVSEVADAFTLLGFEVVRVDEDLKEGQAKREDLRLSDPGASSDWTAIVEVRGYAKSAGKTSDFQRLLRFAEL